LPIEDPCSKLQGIFDRKECGLFYDSLAFAVQPKREEIEHGKQMLCSQQ
jgi:hypothetical protein